MLRLSILILATLALTVHGKGVALPPDCTRNYTVIAGDTCDGISAKQNVSTYQLDTVNAGTINDECSNLSIGQVLCLGIEGHDCTDTHLVQVDETCEVIAKTANTTVGLILENNPNVNKECTNIYDGEVLCVADKEIVKAPKTTCPRA